MQKNYKENYLKSYAIKSINSKGRIYNETESSVRSPYQRDRDRIIHSSSFRRLKHKKLQKRNYYKSNCERSY